MFADHIHKMHRKSEADRRRHVTIVTVVVTAAIALIWLATASVTAANPDLAMPSPAGVAASVATSVGERVSRGFQYTVITISRYFAQ